MVQVQKFELYIEYNTGTGVVQVIQTDDEGRPVDPISLQVSSEFVMTFSNLFSASQQAAIAALTTEKTDLLTAKTNLEAQVAQLSEQVTNLLSENFALQPWNKRWIDPEKFVARFTGPQAQKIYKSVDQIVVGGRDLLDLYIQNNYQIVLDDEQVTGLSSYLVIVGILTPEERASILRDSSSDERYIPTVTE